MIDLIHKWQLFCFCCVIVQIYCKPARPHIRVGILFNLAHDNEA